MQTIHPFLWFDNQAEEAANFYVSVFRNSRIDKVVRKPEAAPGPAGVMIVSFHLDGQEFAALNGGPIFKFNESISFVANCEDQVEIDRLWDALSAGGQKSRCGWLKDRFGVSWQVVPSSWAGRMAGSDPEKINRAMQAIMLMDKLDIAKIDAAYAG